MVPVHRIVGDQGDLSFTFSQNGRLSTNRERSFLAPSGCVDWLLDELVRGPSLTLLAADTKVQKGILPALIAITADLVEKRKTNI